MTPVASGCSGRRLAAGANFAQRLDDRIRLKVGPSHRISARPVIMRCPDWGKQYTFSDNGIVEIGAQDGSLPS